MPKVLQDFLGYAIYFWANGQGEPPHVHVSKGDKLRARQNFVYVATA